METSNERRLRKLITLCAAHGGPAAVAKVAHLSAASLKQIMSGTALPMKRDGTRAERALGDDAARTIETAYNLGRGWFDNDGEEVTMTPTELQLLGLFRELDETLQRAVLEHLRETVVEQANVLNRFRLKRPKMIPLQPTKTSKL